MRREEDVEEISREAEKYGDFIYRVAGVDADGAPCIMEVIRRRLRDRRHRLGPAEGFDPPLAISRRAMNYDSSLLSR